MDAAVNPVRLHSIAIFEKRGGDRPHATIRAHRKLVDDELADRPPPDCLLNTDSRRRLCPRWTDPASAWPKPRNNRRRGCKYRVRVLLRRCLERKISCPIDLTGRCSARRAPFGSGRETLSTHQHPLASYTARSTAFRRTLRRQQRLHGGRYPHRRTDHCRRCPSGCRRRHLRHPFLRRRPIRRGARL